MPFQPVACIVDFHHLRGPEVQQWFGLKDGLVPVAESAWLLLPFFTLPDGSHAYDEEFSYFTLRYDDAHPSPVAATDGKDAGAGTSLFGISCTRHINADELAFRSSDVTRTSVQKAIVAIVDTPYLFPRIRETLSAVTKTWFSQKDFRDVTIIDDFHTSLLQTHRHETTEEYFGMSLRELIHEYKHQTMVLFKCLLLQPKMLFFGANCERLCLLQFALVSLVPGLLRNLQDSSDASLNNYERNLIIPSSLRTSDRGSLLAFMGLPLQLFGKGGFFSPYTPLQQLDVLSDSTTTSYVAGSTNSLLLHHSERYCDAFVNLDEHSIDLVSPKLRTALPLSVPDRRFIDFLSQTVTDTWDPEHPTRPSNHGYTGSEDFIRLQFEEYLLAMLSSVKYKQFVNKHGHDPKALLSEAQEDPASDFGSSWIEAWMQTENYRLFDKFTDSHLFDIVEPRHPTTGALSVEDVQRRVTQQVAELHLDERFNTGKEVLGKHLATGQKKVSTAFNTLWADIEVMREAQRKRSADRRSSTSAESTATADEKPAQATTLSKGPDLSQAQANVQAASARAGAYLSSWGAWASEKRKTGFNRGSSPAPASRAAASTGSEPSTETST